MGGNVFTFHSERKNENNTWKKNNERLLSSLISVFQMLTTINLTCFVPIKIEKKKKLEANEKKSISHSTFNESFIVSPLICAKFHSIRKWAEILSILMIVFWWLTNDIDFEKSADLVKLSRKFFSLFLTLSHYKTKRKTKESTI